LLHFHYEPEEKVDRFRSEAGVPKHVKSVNPCEKVLHFGPGLTVVKEEEPVAFRKGVVLGCFLGNQHVRQADVRFVGKK
jgi:hypothetical protein